MASLHARIAAKLGWTERETHSFSLPALRDMVRPVDPKLASEITDQIHSGEHIVQRRQTHNRADSGVLYLQKPIVEARRTAQPRYGMTRDGYTVRSGAPTSTMIRLQGEKIFRRLMVWQFSNAGTLFVRIDGKSYVVRQENLPSDA